MKKASKKKPVKKKVKKREMTAKQRIFCFEYLTDFNATQAAIRAGYSAKTAEVIGYQLLQKTLVKEFIEKKKEKVEKKLELNAEYVLGNIIEIGKRCMQHEPVRDAEGNETGEYQFKENGALKSQELLGKHLKLFTDVVEHTGKITLTDEERKIRAKKVNDFKNG